MQSTPTPSIALRGVLAVVLMILFYALGAVAIFLLVKAGFGILESIAHMRGRGVITVVIGGLACLAAAGVLAWSLLPRIDHFIPPGSELLPEDEPLLFAEIAAIAEATGQKAPAHVYAVLDMNAFVTERGGLMGLGSRRVMGLGVPLMQVLTVAELRAVIAHEFGHYYGGDTKLGPWIYKTRGAIVRAVNNLGGAANTANEAELGLVTILMIAIRKPFEWFGKGFMRITQAISRRQEIAADALACRVVGSEPLAAGLQKIAGADLGYQLYLQQEVSPLIDKGFRPPVIEGFSRFLKAENIQALMTTVSARELDEGKGGSYDSHPPLRQRVDAAHALGAPTRTPDERPALALLSNPDALELENLNPEIRGLPTIAWDQAVDVYRTSWQETAKRWSTSLTGLTPATLPFNVAEVRARLALGLDGRDASEVDDEDVLSWGQGLYHSVLSECLVLAGFTARTTPGEPVVFLRGGLQEELPTDLAEALGGRFDGKLDHHGWVAFVTEAGIRDASLVPAVSEGDEAARG